MFEELLVEHAPPLSAHLRVHGITGPMYMFNWLQSLFLQVCCASQMNKVIRFSTRECMNADKECVLEQSNNEFSRYFIVLVPNESPAQEPATDEC